MLEKCESEGHKVSFTEDIVVEPGYPTHVGTIFSAIKNMRDAVCHLHIKRAATNDNSFSFFSVYGKGHIYEGMKTSYDDDLAFFYGQQRLYLRRHIVRAFKEAEAFLISKNPWISHQLYGVAVILPAYDYDHP